MRTMQDEQAEALAAEFPPFSVWVDMRPQDDGQPHWHARCPGWDPWHSIHAYDVDGMRAKLRSATGGTL